MSKNASSWKFYKPYLPKEEEFKNKQLDLVSVIRKCDNFLSIPQGMLGLSFGYYKTTVIGKFLGLSACKWPRTISVSDLEVNRIGLLTPNN